MGPTSYTLVIKTRAVLAASERRRVHQRHALLVSSRLTGRERPLSTVDITVMRHLGGLRVRRSYSTRPEFIIAVSRFHCVHHASRPTKQKLTAHLAVREEVAR